MPADKTGVQFINTVPENDSLHIMNYEYLYNGHGVAAGDFNNDGWDDIFVTGNAVPSKLFINKKNYQKTNIDLWRAQVGEKARQQGNSAKRVKDYCSTFSWQQKFWANGRERERETEM